MATLVERERELAAIEALLGRGGESLVIEGGVGLGKTSLIEAACGRAVALGHEVLRARGSELERDFAFGIVRQLFERRLARSDAHQREALLAGPAGAVRPLLLGEVVGPSAFDTSFAVLHGLYWLTANLANREPVLIAVDDAQWADAPSLRWLAHLAPRLPGLATTLLVAHRPAEPGALGAFLVALDGEAATVLRPALLSESAARTVVRATLSANASDDVCAALWRASAGNPLYLTELVRGVEAERGAPEELELGALLAGGQEGIARRVLANVRGLDPRALGLAQALAVLGDGCELRHAAAIAGLEMPEAIALAAGLVRLEVLAGDDPPRFIHPVVRDAIEASLGTDERDRAHRDAARLLHADGAPAGRVAAHLMFVRPAGDRWVLDRLREAAQVAMESGAPPAAAGLLDRALAEPPRPADRVLVLREAARAQASAGLETACTRLEEALTLSRDPRERAEIALEVAEAYAALFRWVDAVDVLERALAELADRDGSLAARLEGELVVCGLHDARRASRVAPVLARLSSRSVAGHALAGGPAEAMAVGQGMAMVLAGRPAEGAAGLLEAALSAADPRAENWDTRAALLWSLVVAERFDSVAQALGPMIDEVHRSGTARGLVAVYSTLGLLNLRLGRLPEADAGARVALRVLQEGDFGPGLAFAVTVLADVAGEAGELAESQSLLGLLPQEGWPAGLGTVLIPAARARLRLAQDRPADALADFETCLAMFSPQLWGTEMRDVGYLHARSGAAMALLRLGERERARELAGAELADVVAFGAPRAIGVAARVAGLAAGGAEGIERLRESVDALRRSPASLELAHSLTELGAALRRAGRRAAAREPLAEALELAARCGARPLASRAREELTATGARPRREWRTGVEALTPSELRIVRLAVEGRTNREIAHELYITLKTVEGHLSRAYTKLGITGRRELPDVLRGEKTRVVTL
ncbi:MAG: AAA family ATPase [Solirubrobacterales bacterium]|nr:AAA family ATPase [Solirubrobacterales bacterium]